MGLYRNSETPPGENFFQSMNASVQKFYEGVIVRSNFAWFRLTNFFENHPPQQGDMQETFRKVIL